MCWLINSSNLQFSEPVVFFALARVVDELVRDREPVAQVHKLHHKRGKCLCPLAARVRIAGALLVDVDEVCHEHNDLVAVFDARDEVGERSTVARVLFQVCEIGACGREVLAELCFEAVADPDVARENARALFAVDLRLHSFEPLFEVDEVGKREVNHVTILVLLNFLSFFVLVFFGREDFLDDRKPRAECRDAFLEGCEVVVPADEDVVIGCLFFVEVDEFFHERFEEGRVVGRAREVVR